MPVRRLRRALRCQAEAGAYPGGSVELPGSPEADATCPPGREEEADARHTQGQEEADPRHTPVPGTSLRGQQEADARHTQGQQEADPRHTPVPGTSLRGQQESDPRHMPVPGTSLRGQEEADPRHTPVPDTSLRGQEEADTSHSPLQEEKESSLNQPPRLGSQFFDQPCVALARALLGQVLARRLSGRCGEVLRACIVETEAYLGGEDAASHSRGGRRTVRNTAMFMAPGTLYVYQIYGLYFCMNVSSQGTGAAVLLRALEPLWGCSAMRRARLRPGSRQKPLHDWELCNGPSKLCQALHIDKSFDRRDLASDTAVWVEPGPATPEADIVCAARVGIGPSAGDWAAKPLRFYLRGNRSVSVRSRTAESGAQPLGS